MASIESRLQALHDEYASAVNMAIAEDREELVPGLVDEYADAALQLMTEDAAA
jgi:pyruvoyl-dependent arginine decarboxylase (PvlArgDC)